MNLYAFLQTLPYMLKGMAGIFAVTFLIMLCIAALNRATARKRSDGAQHTHNRTDS